MTAPVLIVCMGVSGVGKSTCAQMLAACFDLNYVEADDFHSMRNRLKMSEGEPLTDAEREPWMEAVCTFLVKQYTANQSCMLAHSGLRKRHRDQLRATGFRTLFLHLDAERDVIARRIQARNGHYMPASLLDSQFEALETTVSEVDIRRVDVDTDEAAVTARLSAAVHRFLTMETANAPTAVR